MVESSILVDAQDNTLRAGDMPFFYWPRFRGGVDNIPLRGVSTGFGDYEGVMVETTWDVYSLLGIKPPDGIDMTIDVDGYSKRGGGLGYDLAIDRLGHKAQLDLYGMYDSGQQVTDTGIVQDVPKEIRYATLWENTLQLDPSWTIQTQARPSAAQAGNVGAMKGCLNTLWWSGLQANRLCGSRPKSVS